jgi:hypothetical protein
MVSKSSPMPETEIRADESKSSSNKGINTALILTVVLAIVIVIGALLAIPHENWSSANRPENGGSSSPTPTNINTLAPGTLGAVINKTGSESTSDLSRSQNQKVQSDTISPVGPGGFAKNEAQYDPHSRLLQP